MSRSSAEDEQPEDEAAVADASTTVVPPASGPHTMSQEQSSQAQQEDAFLRVMEEAYVNPSSFLAEDETHDGNDSASAALQSTFLRQEEEESTQDLLKEMLHLQAQQRQMDIADSNTSQDLGLVSQNKTNDVDTSSFDAAQVRPSLISSCSLSIPKTSTENQSPSQSTFRATRRRR